MILLTLPISAHRALWSARRSPGRRIAAAKGDVTWTRDAQDRRDETRAANASSLTDGSTTESSEIENADLWRAAIKLPMYWVAVIPVMVGAATAFHQSGFVSLGCVGRLLLGAICVIAWLNLSNDVFDHETGADVTKRESIVNLNGNASLIFNVSLLSLATGMCLLGSLVSGPNGVRAMLMLGLAIACGYLYQGPPFRLSYQGLGEPLCFAAFGPLATPAFHLLLSQTPVVSSACWAASILVGITTTIVLFCSHFHQFESDKFVNKLSPVVRLGGPHNAIKVLSGSMWALFLLTLGLSMSRVLPPLLLLFSVVPLLFAVRCFLYGRENLNDLSKLRFLKLYALDLHASFGMALILTLSLSRMLIF